MFLISSAKVCIEVIAGRHNNGFHFSPKGKNGVQNAIGPWGVKIDIWKFAWQTFTRVKVNSLTVNK